MYKVVLVDDEYMIVEGLKKLVPFERYQMEVVYGAHSAQEALAYIKEHPVDIIITDVNMPDMNGLDMIAVMQTYLPHAAYIILSGYREFEYVKAALNLHVVDYLVKPVDKIELGEILERLSHKLAHRSSELSALLREDVTEEEVVDRLADYPSLWLGAAEKEQGFTHQPYTLLGKQVHLYLSEKEEDGLLAVQLHQPYAPQLRTFKENLEKYLFYGKVNIQQTNSVFTYYAPMYRVIIQGNLQQILDELGVLEEIVLKTTPRVATTKQLFIQFVMDVFHLFEHLQADDMTVIIKRLEESSSFSDLSLFMHEEISRLFGEHRLNENVASVLEMINAHYRQDISLKDISAQLFINPVYLGQLIKRETDSTFAELLNKQRIKAAQQLLLATNDSIEDICYAVGYSNVGYFYKVFRKLCGKSPKAYRKQV